MLYNIPIHKKGKGYYVIVNISWHVRKVSIMSFFVSGFWSTVFCSEFRTMIQMVTNWKRLNKLKLMKKQWQCFLFWLFHSNWLWFRKQRKQRNQRKKKGSFSIILEPHFEFWLYNCKKVKRVSEKHDELIKINVYEIQKY